MQTPLPPLASLRAFEAAARLQSFKAAAAELFVSATAISHQIRALETALNCRLFIRKTRAVTLSPQGRTLYLAVREGLETIRSGVASVQRPSRSAITLSATPAFATKWLVPRLALFQAAYPEVDLHIHASNQPVDLVAGVADLAIRYGQGQYAHLLSTPLLPTVFAPVASPRLKVYQLADLSQHPLIHFDWQTSLPWAFSWAHWAQTAGVNGLDTQAGVRYSEESHAIQAAIAGQGVALLNLTLIDEEIQMGLLESHLKPALAGMQYYVVRPAQSARIEAVQQVEDWLLATASSAHG